MKLAIASLGKDIESEISPQAGRAPYYLFFEEGEIFEVFKNPFVFGSGGAGSSVAKVLIDNNINKVIAGKFGNKMEESLKNAQIDFKIKEGLVKDFIN